MTSTSRSAATPHDDPAGYEPGTDLSGPAPDATPPEKLSTLAGEYIGLSIAGGLLVGLVAAVLLPRASKRKSRKVASGLASSAGELGLALATKALARAGDAVRDTREKAADMGELVGEAVKEHAAPALASASRLIEDGAGKARHTGSSLARKAADIVGKVQSRS